MATSPDRRSEPECARTLFLEELLDDEERGRLASLEHYVARFPQVADFVRAEYSALGPGGAPADEAGVPARVGRYTIRGVLGEGGMGRVYEAFDPELRRRVVVKSLRAELAEKGQAGERLRREARVLGQLLHPNLTRVLDLVEDGGQCHLVLAFHEGRTLGELLRLAREHSEAGQVAAHWLPIDAAAGEVPPAEALRRVVSFFVRTAEALASAHAAGIVHRDLKPQNLMVTAEGAPVVLDFGLALPTQDERLTVAGELLGTPLYMAPEQIEGGAVDARTDVYALGVTLYEALTLVHPFAGSGGRAAAFHRILRGDPVPPRRHRPEVPRDLEAVVLRAMERTPARRYPDMRALARELQRVLDLEPTEARPVSGFGLVWRRVQRRPWGAVGMLAVGIALGIAAWNVQRVDGVKLAASEGIETLAAAVARRLPGDARWFEEFEELTKTVLESIKERSAGDAHEIFLVHPRGKVLQPRSLVWVGLPPWGTPGEDDECFHFDYEYKVSFFDGEKWLPEVTVELRDSPIGCLPIPDGVQLEPGREYRWRVAVERCREVRVEEGVELTAHRIQQLEEYRAVSASDLQRAYPSTEIRFFVAPWPEEDHPTSSSLQVLETLSRHEFWADVLVMATVDDEAHLQESRSAVDSRRELATRALARLVEFARGGINDAAGNRPAEKLR